MGIFADDYLSRLIDCLERVEFTENSERIDDYTVAVDRIKQLFSDVKDTDHKVFFIGNGGSAAIASHMTADFMKNGGVNTYNLYDNAVITCLSNDYGYDKVFSEQISRMIHSGDILVAISSSGESSNIIRAMQIAKYLGGKVLGFTGFNSDNTVREGSDISVYVPCAEYGMVESIHNLILQQIVDLMKSESDNI